MSNRLAHIYWTSDEKHASLFITTVKSLIVQVPVIQKYGVKRHFFSPYQSKEFLFLTTIFFPNWVLCYITCICVIKTIELKLSIQV